MASSYLEVMHSISGVVKLVRASHLQGDDPTEMAGRRRPGRSRRGRASGGRPPGGRGSRGRRAFARVGRGV